MDRHFAVILRQCGTPIILIVNKCEGTRLPNGFHEVYELGIGEPIALSAEHGDGMSDLREALLPYAGEQVEGEEEPEQITDDNWQSRPLHLAIVGRPNVGKSTLVNALLGEERMLTGPEAGLTRDAIALNWKYKEQPIRLVDTAGMRRQARIDERLEVMSVRETLRAIRLSHVVVLVIDADHILDKQDLTIARMVEEEGRGLIIAVNKWDAVEDRAAAEKRVSDRLQTSLTQLRDVPVVMISALKLQKLDALMDSVLKMYAIWNRRISTSELNRWLGAMLESHPLPLVSGRRIKIRYMTQVKARPPTFALWTSKPIDLPESYLRYLLNGLRERFDLPGVPIRWLLRKGDNPYVDK